MATFSSNGKMFSWIPPKSPHGLLQEQHWQDPWRVIIICQMLNQTTRKQVDKVVDEFFARWPTADAFLTSKHEDVSMLLKPLGFYNRRPRAMRKFTEEYTTGVKDVSKMYGVGKYAFDAYRIFCVGDWRSVEPNDHALNKYHAWLKESHDSN